MNSKTSGQALGALYFYASRTPSYTAIGYLVRSIWWQRSPMDFSGQTWLVTGASGGLGRAATLAAAAAGAHVIATARSPNKLADLVAGLPAESQGRVSTVVADMSLQSDTQRLLDTLIGRPGPIDVVLNNVGVLLNDLQVTAEGREASFVTNILSHYLLTEGLMKADKLAANAVVVNISSGGLYTVPLAIKGLNITDPARYQGKAAYAFAKRGQVALTRHWQNKFGRSGRRFYTMHPGWARTQGVKDALPLFWKIQNLILRTPGQGIDTALWLAAVRPDSGLEEVVWFDRKPRSTHAYSMTRTPLCSMGEFIGFLDDELQRGRTIGHGV